MRFIIAVSLLLFLPTPQLSAQDIPLFKIIEDGSGWHEVDNGRKVPPFPKPTIKVRSGVTYAIDGDTVRAAGNGKQTALSLTGLDEPTCLTVWPDGGQLVVGDEKGAWLWAVRIEADGSFGPGDRYYALRADPKKKMPVRALVMDANFLLYACTPLGVQVFDPTGRLSGVILPPSIETMTAITIGGPDGDTLYVRCGAKVYGRPIQVKRRLPQQASNASPKR